MLNLSPAQQQPVGVQRENLDFLASLNRLHQRNFPLDSDLETRIQNYELAARMQVVASDLLNISNESPQTRKMYGLDNETTRLYGLRCLLARKLVEAGVRFVRIHPKPFQPWDTHSATKRNLEDICGNTDLPTAGLIKDLEQVVCGTRRSSSGQVSSAVYQSRRTVPDATTTGTRAEASKRDTSMAKRTKLGTKPPSIESVSPISTRRFCIRWDSTMSC